VGNRDSGQLFPGRLRLTFHGGHAPAPLDVTVACADPALDLALLALSAGAAGPGARPLRLGQLADQPYPEAQRRRWYAYGFPRAHAEGLILSGTVVSTHGTVNGRRALQLDCDQGGRGNLYGASGAAVCCDGAVVGLLHQSDALLDQRELYATPVELIREALAGHGFPVDDRPSDDQPLAHPLHAFPRQVVDFDWIFPSIVQVFAQYCFDPNAIAKTTEVISRANRFRQEADPGDPYAQGIPLYELPPPALVAGNFYWNQVFFKACVSDGRRMVAALLLMLPDFVFSGRAREERDWLLAQFKVP
jgi:hypothetical protein